MDKKEIKKILQAWADDHYWDTMTEHKDIITKHLINSTLAQQIADLDKPAIEADGDRLQLKRDLNKILSDFGSAYENIPDDMDDSTNAEFCTLLTTAIDKILAKTASIYQKKIEELTNDRDDWKATAEAYESKAMIKILIADAVKAERERIINMMEQRNSHVMVEGHPVLSYVQGWQALKGKD